MAACSSAAAGRGSNCAYLQAADVATGPAALAFTANFPEDSTPPVSTADAQASVPPVGGATIGLWKVELSCNDPADSGFAAGCDRSEYRLDGGPVTPYREKVVVEGVGSHTFEYRSVDGAANEEGFRSVALDIVAAPPPSITGFTPASGLVGASVTVNGTNFTGASAVKIGGSGAKFTVVSATTITATVPRGAKSGPISVTTAAGTATSAGSFTVIK